MKKTCGMPSALPSCSRYSHAVSVRSPNLVVKGGPARSRVCVVSRTWRYSGRITAVGMPTAAWHRASPLTASPRPPVLANGQHSAVRCTTPTGAATRAGGCGATAAGPGLRGMAACAGVVFDCRTAVCYSLPSSPRGIIRRELPSDRRHVVLGHVLPQHAPRREVLARCAQRVLHLLRPAERDVACVPRVEQRHHFVFEQTIEPLGVGSVALGARGGGRDGPAVPPIVSLSPPSVQGAELRDGVQCGLHTTRTGRLEGRPREVEPEVDALH